MGRTYAGILGPVAFGAVVAHSVLGGERVEATLLAAPTALFLFAGIGYVIGSIANRTTVEAVEARFHAKLKAEELATAKAMGAKNLASDASQPA